MTRMSYHICAEWIGGFRDDKDILYRSSQEYGGAEKESKREKAGEARQTNEQPNAVRDNPWIKMISRTHNFVFGDGGGGGGDGNDDMQCKTGGRQESRGFCTIGQDDHTTNGADDSSFIITTHLIDISAQCTAHAAPHAV